MDKPHFTIKAERIRPADGRLPALIYRLLEEKTDGRPAFSFLCYAEEGTSLYETEAYLPDVTSDAETAERLLFLLWEGGVTPYALAETVAEWLG